MYVLKFIEAYDNSAWSEMKFSVRNFNAQNIIALCLVDGVVPSQDQFHDQLSPGRPRTRSQVEKMAHLFPETQTEPYGYKIVFKPSFVFLIT